MRDYAATRAISADPDDVFRLLTEPSRLPEWNHKIVRLVEAPEPWTTGCQWVVELSARQIAVEHMDFVVARHDLAGGRDDEGAIGQSIVAHASPKVATKHR